MGCGASTTAAAPSQQQRAPRLHRQQPQQQQQQQHEADVGDAVALRRLSRAQRHSSSFAPGAGDGQHAAVTSAVAGNGKTATTSMAATATTTATMRTAATSNTVGAAGGATLTSTDAGTVLTTSFATGMHDDHLMTSMTAAAATESAALYAKWKSGYQMESGACGPLKVYEDYRHIEVRTSSAASRGKTDRLCYWADKALDAYHKRGDVFFNPDNLDMWPSELIQTVTSDGVCSLQNSNCSQQQQQQQHGSTVVTSSQGREHGYGGAGDTAYHGTRAADKRAVAASRGDGGGGRGEDGVAMVAATSTTATAAATTTASTAAAHAALTVVI